MLESGRGEPAPRKYSAELKAKILELDCVGLNPDS